MTQTDPAPELDPVAEPALPPDDDPAPPRRRLLGWTFWAGLTFGLVCILLGLVVGIWGSRLVPPDPARGPPPAVLPAEPPPGSAPAPRPRRLAPQTSTAAPAPAAPVFPAPSTDPTAAATALNALAQAAEAGAPFLGPFDAVARALPDGPDLRALRELAAVGAPSRAAVAASYDAAAAQAAAAVRAPGPGAGAMARAAHLLTRMVTIRRTSDLTGPGADAVLARAERALGAGDLDGALRELSTLPPTGRQAMGPWRAEAERRLAIERRLSALRATSLGPTGSGANP